MRNLRLLFATLAVVFFLSACTQTETSTISMNEAESIMPGTYKVYFYGEALGAGMFEGYVFEVFDNGTITATLGAETFSGEWAILHVNHSDFYTYELDINISGNAEMDALGQTWWVEDMTDVTLFLTDEAGSPDIHLIKI